MDAPQPDMIPTRFAQDGFVCMPGILSKEACVRHLAALNGEPRAPREWYKGHALSSRTFYEMAVFWPLVEMVKAVLGPDVVLWGSSLIKRHPGEVHLWHSDMESSMPEGRTASLWIGLGNTTAESSLTVLPGSHKLGVTVQEMAVRAGLPRREVTDAHVAEWGAALGSPREPELVPMTDGDVLLFDGRLWHGSHNLSPELNRTALLLQYAEAGTRIRKVDFSKREWPYNFIESPLPPCLAVSGNMTGGANRLTLPPMLPCAREGGRLTGRVVDLDLPIQVVQEGCFAGHASVSQLRGHTHALADFSCHTSALAPGVSPHAPHQHPEEELLLVLDGEVETWIPSLEGTHEGGRQRLSKGQLVFYPAGFYHTLTGAGSRPAHYLMLRWLADPSGDSPALSHSRHDSLGEAAAMKQQEQAMKSFLHFEGPTFCLQKLHCHTTVMEPGGGYDEHIDPYDVLIIVLEGEVETLGRVVGAYGVIYYAAGEPHGLRNPGACQATYLVFEFHGSDRSSMRLGMDFELRDGELAEAARKVEVARKEARALRKELARLVKQQESRRKPLPKLRWYQKLVSRERWARRLQRWSGRAS